MDGAIPKILAARWLVYKTATIQTRSSRLNYHFFFGLVAEENVSTGDTKPEATLLIFAHLAF